MAQIRASIRPVKLGIPLKQALAEDFPKDCSKLQIAGGWGYSRAEAIKFIPEPWTLKDFVAFEYFIAQKIIYYELIICRPRDYRFSGINMHLKEQRLITDGENRYDWLNFDVSCWTDWHWEQLKRAWEDNDFGKRCDFDAETHQLKRTMSQVRYNRDLWFDVTDVFGRRTDTNPSGEGS